MYKVLISDVMDSVAEEILLANGIEVDVKTNFTEEQLTDQIPFYDGLIVRSATKVNKNIIAKASNLKIIGRAGSGVDNIDLISAKEKNIIVMNTPGGNTNATAEHTLSLMMSLLRNIPLANKGTHQGLWEKKKFKGYEARGKNVGIIGFGNVGKRFSEICLMLGMNVSVFSKSFANISKNYPNINPVSFNELITNSDIISFHCKPNSNGEPLINLDDLKLMKRNAFIINTARGGLVNEGDLKIALDQDLISGAAIDVFTNEPAKENLLFKTKNLILTPHIAASTYEAQIIVAEKIALQISNYLNSGEIINSV